MGIPQYSPDFFGAGDPFQTLAGALILMDVMGKNPTNILIIGEKGGLAIEAPRAVLSKRAPGFLERCITTLLRGWW